MTSNARAASAIANYCEKIRPNIKLLADKAEKLRQHNLIHPTTTNTNMKMNINTINNKVDDFKNTTAANLLLTVDPEELIRDAIILDTIYISALINCHPSRRSTVVSILSKPNYCHVDSCSLMIASQGNAYTGNC